MNTIRSFKSLFIGLTITLIAIAIAKTIASSDVSFLKFILIFVNAIAFATVISIGIHIPLAPLFILAYLSCKNKPFDKEPSFIIIEDLEDYPTLDIVIKSEDNKFKDYIFNAIKEHDYKVGYNENTVYLRILETGDEFTFNVGAYLHDLIKRQGDDAYFFVEFTFCDEEGDILEVDNDNSRPICVEIH